MSETSRTSSSYDTKMGKPNGPFKNRVNPSAVTPPKLSISPYLHKSCESLEQAVLTNTIMQMLNINQEAKGWRRMCAGNPITTAGKRLQLLRLVGTIMIPIIVLLTLVGYIFGGRIAEHFQNIDVKNEITFSLELSRMVHILQRERDGSALYVSAIAPETKEFLVSSYPETDRTLVMLSKWPDVRLESDEFLNMENFLMYLNMHRYTLDTDRPGVPQELAFYSRLMGQFMLWFYDAILEARSGSFWKDLVSLQEIVEAREAFGTERALGTIFFTTGRFNSMDDYLTFVQAQDVGDITLASAREYSPIVMNIYNETILRIEQYVDGIVRMRRMIRETVLEQIEPSLANATQWYDSMTLYLDALLSMQDTLSVLILHSLEAVHTASEQTIMIVATFFVIVVVMCPLILNAVYSLTLEIQGYTHNLALRANALNKERQRSDWLRYHMLPVPVAEKLKRHEPVTAERVNQVTIFLSDIVSFPAISSNSSPLQVVSMLNELYQTFDQEIHKYNVHRVETVGDSHMLASGLPFRDGPHASEVCTLAIDLLSRIGNVDIPHMPGKKFRLRIGCHTGTVLAGIVGTELPRYWLIGETVRLAACMKSSSLPSKIQISAATYAILQEEGGFHAVKRDDIMSKALPVSSFWLQSCDAVKHTLKWGTRSLSDSEASFSDDLEYDYRLSTMMALDDVDEGNMNQHPYIGRRSSPAPDELSD